ncbi:thermonuclease family protein [Aquibium carbonis]|uniref:thermonuclease family protein n=1 Tax=Aquibium carbonis TaxID=2495581 RepID=UPI001AECFE04|nr:thermonuclease family protein [Aquibium carbonis]
MPAAASSVLSAQATDGGGRSIRQIAPEIVAPPVVDPGQLEREPPREPLSDLGTAGKPQRRAPARSGNRDAAVPGTPQFFRPVAAAAGRLEGGGLTVVIAGIDILEPDATCQGANGEWPCGMAARTAFRSFLRGRALDCDLPDGDLPERLAAACRLGTQDLGAWLVVNGWAKVSSVGPYAEEQAEAVENRRGIFGRGPDPLPPSPALESENAPTASDGAAMPLAAPLPAEPPPPAIERQALPAPTGLY